MFPGWQERVKAAGQVGTRVSSKRLSRFRGSKEGKEPWGGSGSMSLRSRASLLLLAREPWRGVDVVPAALVRTSGESKGLCRCKEVGCQGGGSHAGSLRPCPALSIASVPRGQSSSKPNCHTGFLGPFCRCIGAPKETEAHTAIGALWVASGGAPRMQQKSNWAEAKYPAEPTPCSHLPRGHRGCHLGRCRAGSWAVWSGGQAAAASGQGVPAHSRASTARRPGPATGPGHGARPQLQNTTGCSRSASAAGQAGPAGPQPRAAAWGPAPAS